MDMKDALKQITLESQGHTGSRQNFADDDSFTNDEQVNGIINLEVDNQPYHGKTKEKLGLRLTKEL